LPVRRKPAAEACRWRTLYWRRNAQPQNDDVVELELAAADLRGNPVFLEHVYDRRRHCSTAEVIVRRGPTLAISRDLGETWREIAIPNRLKFERCFTTDSGRHLLQQEGSGEIHVFDAGWRYLGSRAAGEHNWHGSWSIDQSASGTIMFCEYADLAPIVRVLRSTDDGESWKCVFTQRGHEHDPGAGPVRHFHTCQADPFVEGRWYLSSGDRGAQNGLWFSDDEGMTWERAETTLAPATEPHVPAWRVPNLLRHTAEVIRADSVVWPTDDNLASAARLVRLDKRYLSRLDVVATFGRNELRSLVALEDELLFVISESKLDSEAVEVYCVTDDGRILAAFAIENEKRARISFTSSLSSKAASDGVFFSFCDLPFDRNPHLLKWSVRVGTRDESEDVRQRLLTRIAELKGQYGPEHAEVYLFEDRYIHSFQCNMCSEDLADSFVRAPGGGYEGVVDPSRFEDEHRVEYHCPHCESRVRQRTARIVLARHVRNRRGRALLVSTTRPDRRWLARHYSPITHVALHGEFDDPAIITGTDIREMPHIESHAYDFMYATVVLDYIPELHAVAREAHRVLKRGGEFAFFIMPNRLRDDDMECIVEHRNALAHEAYATRDGASETGIPSCVFGIDYVAGVFREAGFLLDPIRVFDPLSETTQPWFVATKPALLPPWRRLSAPPRGVALHDRAFTDDLRAAE
jgi:hypothetical protein